MSFPLIDVLLFNIIYFFSPHHAPTLSFTALHYGFFPFFPVDEDISVLLQSCSAVYLQTLISPPYGFHFTTGTAVNFQTRQIWCEIEVTRQQ